MAVSLELRRDGPSLDAFMPLVLPSGTRILVEVDMGSDSLILDERFVGDVGVDLSEPTLQCREATDETGHRYVRTFGRYTEPSTRLVHRCSSSEARP